VRAGTVLKNYAVILVLILRLRQCVVHPSLILASYEEEDLQGLEDGDPNNPNDPNDDNEASSSTAAIAVARPATAAPKANNNRRRKQFPVVPLGNTASACIDRYLLTAPSRYPLFPPGTYAGDYFCIAFLHLLESSFLARCLSCTCVFPAVTSIHTEPENDQPNDNASSSSKQETRPMMQESTPATVTLPSVVSQSSQSTLLKREGSVKSEPIAISSSPATVSGVKREHVDQFPRSAKAARTVPNTTALEQQTSANSASRRCPVCSDVSQILLLALPCGHSLCDECALIATTPENVLKCFVCKIDYSPNDLRQVDSNKTLPGSSSTDLPLSLSISSSIVPGAPTQSSPPGATHATTPFSRSWIPSAKIEALVAELRKIKMASQQEKRPVKAVVFTQWTGVLDMMTRALTDVRMKLFRLDGSLNLAARQEVLADFAAA
jgi:SNF2 family DNA or RNA helicase